MELINSNMNSGEILSNSEADLQGSIFCKYALYALGFSQEQCSIYLPKLPKIITILKLYGEKPQENPSQVILQQGSDY